MQFLHTLFNTLVEYRSFIGVILFVITACLYARDKSKYNGRFVATVAGAWLFLFFIAPFLATITLDDIRAIGPHLLAHNRYVNFLGIAVILGIAYLFSFNRAKVDWRLVGWALGLQWLIALGALKWEAGRNAVDWIAGGFDILYGFADYGSRFVFGNLADPTGPWAFVFGIKVLPIIIFFGALMALLFHIGVIQLFVAGISKVICPLLGTSGAETLCAISNSFLGQTEAPLVVRHYLKTMTRSEMLLVMISGMATISGAILAVFAAMGVPAEHMLAGSVMSIPSSILISKILYPETEKSQTAGGADVEFEKNAQNTLDAISTGTSDGLSLALNVGAMLISFLALLALFDAVLGLPSLWFNMLVDIARAKTGYELAMIGRLAPLSVNTIFSYLFAPIAYLMGFVGDEALAVGQLLGTKVAVNELIAYGELIASNLSARTTSIVTYALCGFSNFSCIGIQLGGIGALVPEKRKWLSEFGLYAVLGGALANILNAMVASVLL